jgi:superfamily II DNA or RNA helicase
MRLENNTHELERDLHHHFVPVVRQRGKEYFEEAAVEELTVLDDGVWGLVEGTHTYALSLRWTLEPRRSILHCFCSCPAFEKYGPCKHLWALVLEIDEGGLGPEGGLSEPIKIVHESLEEMDPAQIESLGVRESGDDDERAGATARPQGARPPALSGADKGGWSWALKLLEASSPGRRDPLGDAGAAPGNAFEIRYVLDANPSILRSGVRLWMRVHRLLKNGKWSVGSDYISTGHNTPQLHEASDRRIHALLQGAMEPNSGYYGAPKGRDGYRVGAELFARLLPELAATERLYCGPGGEAETGPIALDEGARWEFKPALARDESQGELVLAGKFTRAAETLALDGPALLYEAGYLIVDARVARFGPREALPMIDTLRKQGPIRAPIETWPRFVQLLTSLSSFEPAAIPGLEPVAVGAPKPGLFVAAASRRQHHAKHFECRITLGYGAESIDLFDPREWIVDDEGRGVWRRDFDQERRAVATFLEHGGQRGASSQGLVGELFVPTGQVARLIAALLEEGWEVQAGGKLWRTSGGSSFTVRSGIDWFDLEGELEFGGGQVASLPTLLEAAKNGAKTVQLGDGTLGVLPERWLESWGLLNLAGKPHGEALRFTKQQGWLLDALLAERENVRVDQGFEQLRERLAGSLDVRPKREPQGFGGQLRPYQRDGLGWFERLRSLGLGGCLADDMGLGKTVQVLALLESRRLTRRRKGGVDLPSLVVAPRSLIFNWIDEARRFTPKLRVLDYTGADRHERLGDAQDADLCVTTYGTLLRDVLELRERTFDYLVLDEAQAIKNAASQSAKAVRLLQAHHRLALSGTPIENHLGELWSLFEFLNPGMLGAARAFQKFSGLSRHAQADDAGLGRLSRALAPFFLRRTKEEVLKELPEKTEQVLHCRLKGAERGEYDRLRDYYRKSLVAREQEVGLPRMKIQVLEALLRLRQAACHPGLIDQKRKQEGSAKLNTLLPMLEEICREGHKALVFSQFTSLLGILRRNLEQRDLTYEYLDGRTQKRKEKVERFQTDPDCPLFLISIKAGGHGLNLTAADYVFLLDPWWNPAVESQAIDRVHRIGRTKPVIAYRLIATDTVEEKVVALQEHKRKLADAILGQGRVGLRDLSREDLELLLS